jgi:hypothetical protein
VSWHPAQYDNWLGQWLGLSQLQAQLLANTPKTDVLQLMSLSPEVRISHLEAITQQSNSQESVRARYVLASDLIQQQKGKQALSRCGMLFQGTSARQQLCNSVEGLVPLTSNPTTPRRQRHQALTPARFRLSGYGLERGALPQVCPTPKCWTQSDTSLG